MRAAVYTRVSTAEQSQHGTSLESQAADCRRLATELGADVVAEYQDVDSGAAWDLPGLMAALDAAKRHEFDVLLVSRFDRLARDLTKQLVVERELNHAGVQVQCVAMRVEDSAEGRLLKNMSAVIAAYEREVIALRTTRGRWAKASRGQVVGAGWAPYGYQFVRDAEGRTVALEPDPATALIVRRIVHDLARMSVRAVCDGLNADGIPAYHGGRWSDTTILGMLANPVYTGQAAWGRSSHAEPVLVTVPALVSAADVEAARDGLQRRRLAGHPVLGAERDPYTLRGLLTCGHCGGQLAATPNNGYRFYACIRHQPRRAAMAGVQPCPMMPATAERVEAYAWGVVTAALLDPEALAASLAEHQSHRGQEATRRADVARGLERQIASARTRLDNALRIQVDPDALPALRDGAQRQAETAAQDIARLEAQHVELEAAPLPGLDEAAITGLRELAAALGADIATATGADQRATYEALHLRGTMRYDPERGPVQLGRRGTARYHLELDALIALSHGDRDFKKTRVRFYTQDYGEWERRHLASTVGT